MCHGESRVSGISELATRLADRYQLQRELGAGGMATVYLAHDLRHERKVAIKVLRPELAAVIGAERFVREIRTMAALQHPHILGLIDSGEVQGTAYYVMPFVEGESLRDQLVREKQLPIADGVRIATEVASALDYAHRHGVIHRDIKPENILLHDGTALVADFGIALAVSQAGSTRMTETGMSLGTPHYMSPEQAMGEREITARSDVYALGCVTYEMLTGEPPFTGATAQAIVARVLTEAPRLLTAQRHTIPEHVEGAVLTALEKLPADRFGSAVDFAQALSGVTGVQRQRSAQLTARATGASSSRRFAALGAVAVLATALALWGWLRRPPASAAAPVARFAVRLTPPPTTGMVGQSIALSPDGDRIVYVGPGSKASQLFTRSLDQLAAVPIPGTEGGLNPFFSPDGAWLGFSVGPRLFKLSLAGGPPLPICGIATNFWGGTWSRGDTILFADTRGLQRVPAGGGVPVVVAAPDSGGSEVTYRWPELLPGEKAAIFARTVGLYDEELATLTLATGEVKRLGIRAGNPHYVDQGFVLVTAIDSSGTLSNGVLTALPFDPVHLTVTGPPIPVADSVQTGGNSRTVKMGVSRGGAMVLATGRASQGRLVLSDRAGKQRPVGDFIRLFIGPRFSPDGRRIAVTINEGGAEDIWTFDLRSQILSRLTFDRAARMPEWSPDGRRIVYAHRRKDYDLSSIAADGSGEGKPLLEAPGEQVTGVLTPDQHYLLVREGAGSGGRRRISIVRLDSAKTMQPLLSSDVFDHYTPAPSPNGRWLAYVSEESGRPQVYVRPFLNAGGRHQISSQGGIEPVWARSGRELFFWTADTLMVADVSTGAEFLLLGTRRLFTTKAVTPTLLTNYDVSPDGTTFVLHVDENWEPQVVFVLNWFDRLTRRRGQ